VPFAYDRPMPVDDLTLHRMSLDEYHRLIEAGAFDEDLRVELIDGLLVEMSPKGREHELCGEFLTRWLVTNTDPARFRVRAGGPLTIPQARSEPEPDFAVVPVGVDEPFHPATALLVVEVAASSLRYDLGRKAGVYAAARVPEYWVVDVHGRRMWVHEKPDRGEYTEVRARHEGEELRCRSVPLPAVAVADLLPASS
jgi:Uma2 family endonuclease